MKSRYWSFIVYPDSAPENWRDIITETGVEWCCSPLHDSDINQDGEKKKLHFHVLVLFYGPTTYQNIKNSYCDKINATIPQRVLSVRGIYRYFTHKDNPEKFQYDEKFIECFNGFEYSNYMSSTDETMIFINIINIINALKIKSYSYLIDYFLSEELYDYLRVSKSNTYFFTNYIKGKSEDF